MSLASYSDSDLILINERRRRFARHQATWDRYAADKAAFIREQCQIYDATARTWIPFDLWPAQEQTLQTMQDDRLVVILKARQLGLTWLCLGDVLHEMLFHPVATVSLFSRRDDEAVYLLSDERLKGMYSRLPDWIQARARVTVTNDHEWQLSNGSIARAFPTSAGDSYTASYALVDEADLVPDLGALMRAVKPTIDGGGRMVLLSRVDKSQPMSEFKATYRGAKAHENGWAGVFLPWHVRPSRDAAWYEAQRRDIESRTGALDDLHEQYPATDTEALAPKSLDKRIPNKWIEQCYHEAAAIDDPLGIPGLVVYSTPQPGHRYVVGMDPAEGNPTSDDSAATFMDAATGEEAARLKGKFQPAVFAAHVDRIGRWYNYAGVLPERNNHGHAVILWFADNSRLFVLLGHDEKPGWMDSSRGKVLLYDQVADDFRLTATTLHSFDTYTQLASIEGASLRAPEGQLDDLADSYALACIARTLKAPPSLAGLSLSALQGAAKGWQPK